MKKVLVVQLHLDGEKSKQKVVKAVSQLPLQGVETISMDLKNEKLTMIGDVDPDAVNKLKKLCTARMLSFEPATEPQQEDNGCVIC